MQDAFVGLQHHASRVEQPLGYLQRAVVNRAISVLRLTDQPGFDAATADAAAAFLSPVEEEQAKQG